MFEFKNATHFSPQCRETAAHEFVRCCHPFQFPKTLKGWLMDLCSKMCHEHVWQPAWKEWRPGCCCCLPKLVPAVTRLNLVPDPGCVRVNGQRLLLGADVKQQLFRALDPRNYDIHIAMLLQQVAAGGNEFHAPGKRDALVGVDGGRPGGAFLLVRTSKMTSKMTHFIEIFHTCKLHF